MLYNVGDQVTEVENALGQETTYAYDKNGDVTSATNALSQVTQYAYDALDRLTAVTDALGNTTTTIYNSDNQVMGNGGRGSRISPRPSITTWAKSMARRTPTAI